MCTGNDIRVMRIETGVTQQEVAGAWGNSQGLLSLIERGIRVPDEAEVMEIKKAIVSVLQRKLAKYSDIAQRISA